MIQYSLVCENSHRFDAWFKSARTFDEQVASEVVTCPICATGKVAKALMAPSLARGDHRQGERNEPETAVSRGSVGARGAGGAGGSSDSSKQGGAKVSLSAGHPDQAKLAQALRVLREKVTSEADYVGDRFAREARRIHDHEAEPRGIYGEATLDEAASLLEDGVDFMPLPSLPEEQN